MDQALLGYRSRERDRKCQCLAWWEFYFARAAVKSTTNWMPLTDVYCPGVPETESLKSRSQPSC